MISSLPLNVCALIYIKVMGTIMTNVIIKLAVRVTDMHIRIGITPGKVAEWRPKRRHLCHGRGVTRDSQLNIDSGRGSLRSHMTNVGAFINKKITILSTCYLFDK